MESAISKETRNVQNPALGATLLWRFTCLYHQEHTTAAFPPMLLGFIVLPIVLHQDLHDVLRATRSQLRGFAEKFSDTEHVQSDILLSLHDRVDAFRELTLKSLQLAVAARMLSIESSTGGMIPVTESPLSEISKSTRRLINDAETLGKWCAELTLFESPRFLRSCSNALPHPQDHFFGQREDRRLLA